MEDRQRSHDNIQRLVDHYNQRLFISTIGKDPDACLPGIIIIEGLSAKVVKNPETFAEAFRVGFKLTRKKIFEKDLHAPRYTVLILDISKENKTAGPCLIVNPQITYTETSLNTS